MSLVKRFTSKNKKLSFLKQNAEFFIWKDEYSVTFLKLYINGDLILDFHVYDDEEYKDFKYTKFGMSKAEVFDLINFLIN
jgi:hypothetical protein